MQQPTWEQNTIFSVIQIIIIVSWKGTDNKMWDIPDLAWILINKWNHIEAISLSFFTLPRIWKTMNDLMKLLSKSHLKESKNNKKQFDYWNIQKSFGARKQPLIMQIQWLYFSTQHYIFNGNFSTLCRSMILFTEFIPVGFIKHHIFHWC